MFFLILFYCVVTVFAFMYLTNNINNRLSFDILTYEMVDTVSSKLENTLKELLTLFAAGGEEKTEKASHKKLEDAKKKGQTPKSQDIGIAVSLLTAFGLMIVFGGTLIDEIKALMVLFIEKTIDSSIVLNPSQMYPILISVFLKIALFVFIPIMLVGIVSNVAQTGFIMTNEQIKPKLSKLNPINGFKDMFSQRRLFDLIKNLLKLTVVFAITYNFIADKQGIVSELPYLELNQGLALFGEMLQSLISTLVGLVVVIAAIDYGYQRYDFLKKQRMTKQEVKDEYKQAEGDPHIKSLRKQKQREMVRNRMMSAVPSATVVVTNPTHFAVAIKYNNVDAKIPIVVAKGRGNVALKIREIAKENDVIIIENKPLARTLYKLVEVDSMIPVEMYEAVAKLLGLVYQLERKRKYK